jgi:hypothetical protein
MATTSGGAECSTTPASDPAARHRNLPADVYFDEILRS